MPAKNSKTQSIASRTSVQNGFSLISNQKLICIYQDMLQCNLLWKELRSVWKRNGIPVGMEAVAAGVAGCLLPGDTILPERDGFFTGYLGGVSVSTLCGDLLSSPQDAIARLHATLGVALINKAQKNKKAVVVFNDGLPGLQSTWKYALEAAETYSLPIVFVQRGNMQAESSTKQARANRLPSIPVDIHDAVAIHRVASESISRVRSDAGPTLIACVPWTLAQHKPSTPLANMEMYLKQKGLLQKEMKAQTAKEFLGKIQKAVREARKTIA